MLRRTKILATLGPSTDTVEQIEAIIKAGTNVVRMNFSHGTAEDHINRAEKVRTAAKKLGKYVAILGDLQGPKIRIAKFVDGSIILKIGDHFILDADMSRDDGNQQAVGIDYKALPQDVKEGDLLLLDEPTNDIDVNTLRALEEGIENFAGCAVVISHDRWFLDRICTHILAFEGNSEVYFFEGSFSDYEENKKSRLGGDLMPKRIKYKKLIR